MVIAGPLALFFGVGASMLTPQSLSKYRPGKFAAAMRHLFQYQAHATARTVASGSIQTNNTQGVHRGDLSIQLNGGVSPFGETPSVVVSKTVLAVAGILILPALMLLPAANVSLDGAGPTIARWAGIAILAVPMVAVILRSGSPGRGSVHAAIAALVATLFALLATIVLAVGGNDFAPCTAAIAGVLGAVAWVNWRSLR